MTKHLYAACVLAALLAAPASASMPCVLTAVPLVVSAEGWAEPVGELTLRCQGGVPGSLVSGSFRIFLTGKIANSVNTLGHYNGITMSQELPGGFLMNQTATIRPLNDSVLFEGFQIPVSAEGNFSLRFNGIRAEATPITQALLQYSGNQELRLTSPSATVAYSQTTLLATHAGGAGLRVHDQRPRPDGHHAVD